MFCDVSKTNLIFVSSESNEKRNTDKNSQYVLQISIEIFKKNIKQYNNNKQRQEHNFDILTTHLS